MKDAGSVASAGLAVLVELLDRGHQIDLFANRDHVPSPADLEGRSGYGYVGIAPPPWCRLPLPASETAELAVGRRWWRRRYVQAAMSRHRRAPYDVLLTLGVAPAFVLDGVPTVTWLQGPLHTELEALRRLRPTVSRVSGRRFYYSVTAYYRLRTHRDRHLLDSCDEVVCGSAWARSALASRGFPTARLHALPYPVDLDRFRPAAHQAVPRREPVLLSLGRLDPRKRLDLLVEAFDMVARVAPGARLQIVGRPGYAPNQLSLLETSEFRSQIDVRPAVAQADIPDLIRAADVMVQPSENENFGSSVAEALACGVPVVVGPTNGTGDYIDEGSAVFTSYTPEAVSAAVLQVLERRRKDPVAAACSARASAERWFPVDLVVDRLERILAHASAGERAHRGRA